MNINIDIPILESEFETGRELLEKALQGQDITKEAKEFYRLLAVQTQNFLRPLLNISNEYMNEFEKLEIAISRDNPIQAEQITTNMINLVEDIWPQFGNGTFRVQKLLDEIESMNNIPDKKFSDEV